MAKPATKKSTAKTRPVYYANVAFYVPRKGVVINETYFHDDYATMVYGIFSRVFYYTSDAEFQNFDVDVKTSSTVNVKLVVACDA